MQHSLQVESIPLDRVLPYAANARTHPDEQIAQIAASIAEFGFVNPVLVDADGVLIAGHGRVMAARRLGLTTVPALRLGHLSPAQARALRLADNQIALNSGWDEALLAAEIARIRDEAVVDLDVLGFSGMELDRLLASLDAGIGNDLAQNDLDAPAPEPPTEPVTRPGDLWLLGRQRLLCGDATNPADVDRLLAGVQPHLMVTDPPYGVDYNPSWRNEAGVSTTLRTGRVANDHRADWREAWALFPGDVAYVWHAGVHARTVIESLEAAGFAVRSQIVWAKPRLVLGRGDYHWQHEPCLYAVRKGATGHWQGARDQTTLWPIGNGAEDLATVHGTQKPVECMRRPMLNNSRPGDPVYEPFCGSGSTIIAAETIGRTCFAMDIDPGYCDVAVQRWQEATGEAAVLAGEDRVFADVAAMRGADHDVIEAPGTKQSFDRGIRLAHARPSANGLRVMRTTETTMTRTEKQEAREAANQQKSLEAFMAAKAEFDALVAELQAMSADHFGADPEAVLWEHAEMLKDWNTRLRDITDAYHRRGEYAQ